MFDYVEEVWFVSVCYSHVAADASPKAAGISQIAEKSTHAAGDVYLAIMNEMLSLIFILSLFFSG